MPTLKEIVKEHLETNNYDGLFLPDLCSCSKDDLFECRNYCMDCEPGYIQPESDEENYIIGGKKL